MSANQVPTSVINHTKLQTVVKDCGVFVITFAYHAAKGDDLSKMIFNQKKIQEHLVQCFRGPFAILLFHRLK